MNPVLKLSRQIKYYLTIAVRFGHVENLGVDYPHEERYTDGIEVNVLCDQIPTSIENLARARAYSRALFIPILKGD